MLLFSGCVEEKEENNEDETNEVTIDQDYDNMILGNWARNETF